MATKYAFANGILLDGTRNMEPRDNVNVLVHDDRIEAVVDAQGDVFVNASALSSLGYEVIDLNGSYLMPGLINLHVHLAGSGKPKKKEQDNVRAVKLVTANPITRAIGRSMVASFAKTQLMSGTTTVRTVGGIADFDTTIRDDIAQGKRKGPRIIASNMAISVEEGHMAGSLAYIARTADEARSFVREIAADGPDLIKLMITGGVLDAKVKGEPGVLKMPPEIVSAACDEAHKLGLRVAAHTESPEGVRVALEGGVDTIEHGAAPDEHILELFEKTGAALVTTLSPALPFALFDRSVSHATELSQFNGKIVFQGIIDCAKACLEHGITVGLGTDTACPYVTQYDMWRELAYFVKYCGVSPAFALHTATSVNARILGKENEIGTIEAGKCADMIVTAKNPIDDISALRNVSMVVSRGDVLRNPEVKKIEACERELDRVLSSATETC